MLVAYWPRSLAAPTSTKLPYIRVEPSVKLLQFDRRKLAQTGGLTLFRGHHILDVLRTRAVFFFWWSWHCSMLRAPAKYVKKIML
jgi:hypothetical protein